MTFHSSTTNDNTIYESFDTTDINTSYLNRRHYFELFKNCKNIVSSPKIDSTEAVISCGSMFYGCSSLTTAPEINTSGCGDFSRMFQDCTSLTSVPVYRLNVNYINSQYGTEASYMFYNCKSLTNLPNVFINNRLWQVMFMFYGCTSLTTVGNLDLRYVKDARGMFKNCTSLTTVGNLDLRECDTFNEYFSGCTSLTSIGTINMTSVVPDTDWSVGQNVYSTENMFYNCSNLQNIDGLTGSRGTLNFSSCPLITTDSINNIANPIANADFQNVEEVYIIFNRDIILTDTLINKFVRKGYTVSKV